MWCNPPSTYCSGYGRAGRADIGGYRPGSTEDIYYIPVIASKWASIKLISAIFDCDNNNNNNNNNNSNSNSKKRNTAVIISTIIQCQYDMISRASLAQYHQRINYVFFYIFSICFFSIHTLLLFVVCIFLKNRKKKKFFRQTRRTDSKKDGGPLPHAV